MPGAPPLRVIHLADSPYMGGVTSHLLSVHAAFQDRGDVEIVLATLPGRRDDDSLVRRAASLGIAVHPIPMAHRFDTRALGALRALVHQEQADFVHTHGYRGTLMCRAARIPALVVNTCHGPIAEAGRRLRLWQGLELRAMHRHAGTIAVSDTVRQWLLSHGLNPDRTRVIHNGCPPPDDAEPPPSRDALGIPEDATCFLFAGRLVRNKGVHQLFEAAAGLPGVAVIVVGDGPERSALEAAAAQHGIVVHFAGAVENPGPYYRLADVVALPSDREALPMTLIEAAAYGKPAIATAVGGTPEVLREGETGMLVPVGDVHALRAAIKACLDPARRAFLGVAAKERWRSCFSLDTMAGAMAAFYRERLA